MTGRNREPVESTGPDDTDVVLATISETIRTGRVPDLSGISSEETRQELSAILENLAATRQFALAMAQGDLSLDLAARGHMAGSLKSLQASLRHLTWQAEQIAGGDLTQRVHFMGDFSASFNAMVEHLERDERERNEREAELRRINDALAAEIAERKKAEEGLRLAHR